MYKFSDEIVKDRKLFLGKKQMSLYEIYYKDGREHGGKRVTILDGRDDSDKDDDERRSPNEEEQEGMFGHRQQVHNERVQLPRVNKISLSLDRKLRRAQRTQLSRFNEPSTSWSQHRQRTAENTSSSGSTGNHVKANRQHTQGAARTQNMYRLFKKAQSAPLSETRHVRVLGLPPISRQQTGVQDSSDSAEALRAKLGIGVTLPLRPSSKPNKIWRQTSNAFHSGYGYDSDAHSVSMTSVGRLSTRGSSRLYRPVHGSVWT